MIIELKSANGNHFALTKAVCERLDTYKGIYCIESFDPFCLLDLKKLRPDTCRGQLSMNFLKDPSGLPLYKRYIAGNLLLNFLTRPDFVAYKYEDRQLPRGRGPAAASGAFRRSAGPSAGTKTC